MLNTDQWRDLVSILAFVAKIAGQLAKSDEGAHVAKRAEALRDALGAPPFTMPKKGE